MDKSADVHETGSAPPADADAAVASPSAASGAHQEPARAPASPEAEHVTIKPYRAFPPVMQASYLWDLKPFRTLHLGVEAERKMYMVSMSGKIVGGGGKPCIMLHNGPDETDEKMAVAGLEGHRARPFESDVKLLGTDADGANPKTGVEVLRKLVSDDKKTATFRFETDVEPERSTEQGQRRREVFEWRTLAKDEKPKFNMSDFHHGFKLVRLMSGSPEDGNENAPASDEQGLEIVAVAAWKHMWQVSKPFSIALLGSGMTGELGPRWAVMAIVSALKIWMLEWTILRAKKD